MPLLTRFSDPAGQYSVEEDSLKRLWLSVECRGAAGFDELHRLLLPGETRAFERSHASVRARARVMLANPKAHFDPHEEADYRRQ